LSLAKAELYVEAAYRPVAGVLNPGLSLDVGHATAKGLTITERGAGCAGRLGLIREKLKGSIDLAVLELCYRPQESAGIEDYLALVAQHIAQGRGMKVHNAVNAINKITKRAEVDYDEWAEACGIKAKTAKLYSMWARVDLNNMREAACIKAFEG
jgi:hypothetical protein